MSLLLFLRPRYGKGAAAAYGLGSKKKKKKKVVEVVFEEVTVEEPGKVRKVINEIEDLVIAYILKNWWK